MHFILVCHRLFGDNFINSLLFLAETNMVRVNVFLCSCTNEILVGSDLKWKFSPLTPIVKSFTLTTSCLAHFDNVISGWTILKIGLYQMCYTQKIKSLLLLVLLDMTLPKWAIFTMGVYGEIQIVVGCNRNVAPDCIKNVDKY